MGGNVTNRDHASDYEIAGLTNLQKMISKDFVFIHNTENDHREFYKMMDDKYSWETAVSSQRVEYDEINYVEQKLGYNLLAAETDDLAAEIESQIASQTDPEEMLRKSEFRTFGEFVLMLKCSKLVRSRFLLINVRKDG